MCHTVVKFKHVLKFQGRGLHFELCFYFPDPQLQEAFGWEAFIEIFFKYQEMPYIPRDKALKMNLWVEMFSQQVKKNLAPFFKAWGWPIEENLSQQLADSFPIWSENPMERYISQ